MFTDWSPCTNLLVIEQMTPQLRGLKQHSFIYHKAGAASQIPPGGLGLLTAWQLAPGANSGACGISTHKNNCCFIPTSSACPCLQGMPVCSILSGPFSAQNNSKGKICPLQWGPLGWMPPPMTEWVALASYIVLCLLTGGHTFSLNREGFKGERMSGEEEEGEACKLRKRGGIGWFRGSTGCNLFSL